MQNIVQHAEKLAKIWLKNQYPYTGNILESNNTNLTRNTDIFGKGQGTALRRMRVDTKEDEQILISSV